MAYRVIVVDDDEDLRTFVRMSLYPKYEVVEATDGLDALNKLETYQPDFAILDLEMPVMDGLELCQAIRRHPQFQIIPVIFLSGHGEKENIKKSYASGADLYMLKPIDPQRLLKNVDFTLEHSPRPPRPKRNTIEQLKQMDGEAQVEADQMRRQSQATQRPAPAPEPRMAPPPPPPPPVEEESYFDTSPEQAFEESIKQEEEDPNRPIARVMIVDDEEDTLTLMQITLNRDFEVTMAHNGMEAIEKMVEYQPDILLIDVMMPRMNGLQLLQIIRRNAAYRHMPIVVVSARASERDKVHALRSGANDFIGKPFSPDGLLQTIKNIASAPSFQISPKKVPIQEIVKREFLATKDKWDEASQQERRHKYAEIEEIIRQEARKRPK